jgi:ligand-binding SRPBCC domain-containing protein
MPHAAHRFHLQRDPEVVFASWIQASERLRLTPPELNLELVEGPAVALLGARFLWKIRRWGLTQRWQSEIVRFEPFQTIVEVQTQGPFPVWRHTLRIEPTAEGSWVCDDIEFESPTGLLGRWLTPDSVQRELTRAWSYRDRMW